MGLLVSTSKQSVSIKALLKDTFYVDTLFFLLFCIREYCCFKGAVSRAPGFPFSSISKSYNL